jgi:hypothetical protein
MWLVGASIALAGMWTYVAWGRVRREPFTFELASLTHSYIWLGNTSERWREELPRISFPQASAARVVSIRCQVDILGFAHFLLLCWLHDL